MSLLSFALLGISAGFRVEYRLYQAHLRSRSGFPSHGPVLPPGEG